ncbi:MAG: VWA domain-containing protein [Phycisphaeraceae bacterium]|nr:VWA domain-containing protein [Phycisphaeraceae bacterium]MBX3367131.1 VWA domain-containing protein [Phycisphaeraceae bacterium]
MTSIYHSPWAFALILLAAAIVALRPFSLPPPIVMPGAAGLRGLGSLRSFLRWAPLALRLAALCLIAVAIARPQTLTGRIETSKEGVAIQLVIDRSASMGAPMTFEGRSYERLEVVKRVLKDFILGDGKQLKGRADDLIGLIVFSGYADTLAPLSHSHQIVVDLANSTQLAPPALPEGGTAIGDALALAASRLRSAEEQIKALSDANRSPEFRIKSKIIVLLTDGEHNRGEILPEPAARLAAEWGIKIYSIGIGGTGGVVFISGMDGRPIPIRDHVDERTLTTISNRTGGRYWNARNAESLREIYEEIDRLEKISVTSQRRTVYEERFPPLVNAALWLIGIEIFLASTLLRRLP